MKTVNTVNACLPKMEPDEARRVRRCIMRRNNKIFELLKSWRLEGGVIDRIEAHIRRLIEWFDAQNKLVAITAEAFGTTIREFRNQLDSATPVHEMGGRAFQPG
jgi:RNA polymerase primary sigma factor